MALPLWTTIGGVDGLYVAVVRGPPGGNSVLILVGTPHGPSQVPHPFQVLPQPHPLQCISSIPRVLLKLILLFTILNVLSFTSTC